MAVFRNATVISPSALSFTQPDVTRDGFDAVGIDFQDASTFQRILEICSPVNEIAVKLAFLVGGNFMQSPQIRRLPDRDKSERIL